MSNRKICLASDNWAPAHPSILQAVVDANEGYAPPYGSDTWTERAQQAIQHSVNRTCSVFVVPTGTGANVLGLRLACHRHESILCSEMAHITYQESGAAEALIGCKLLTIPHHQGKITPDGVLKKLKMERAFGKHSTSPRVLSITQPTEVGTTYHLEALGDLSTLCKEEGLLFHMDGSRLYNAAVSLNVSLSHIVEAAQLDILSLGGTKNGLLGVEALLIFNDALRAGSDHVHKQTLQLLSKTRYASAQYIPFFQNELWKTLASQANQQARKIATAMKEIRQLTLSYPVETNQIFFTAPAAWLPRIQDAIFCYPWDQEKNEIRFITSWNTSDEEVDSVISLLTQLAHQSV